MPLDAETYEVLYTNNEVIDELVSDLSNIEVYHTIATPCLSSAVKEIRSPPHLPWILY